MIKKYLKKAIHLEEKQEITDDLRLIQYYNKIISKNKKSVDNQPFVDNPILI